MIQLTLFSLQLGSPIALHSWYARAYMVFEDQTIRIDNFLKDFGIENNVLDWSNVILYNARIFNWKKRAKIYLKKYLYKN